MSKFNILSSLTITGRGPVIVGEIEEGRIEIGQSIAFLHEGKMIKKEIEAIEYLDNVSNRMAHIGLVFKYESENEKQFFATFRIISQTAIIK
jgi:translation elongation factor EF-Tu-like GTPase